MIDERIDEIWHHLDFGSPWYSEKERDRARVMVSKFLAWHRDNPRELVAVEQKLYAPRSARWRSPGGWTGWSGTPTAGPSSWT